MNNIYFKREEFACKCGCGFDTVDVDLLNVLVHIRSHFDSPVYIVSGCRCIVHNISVGGKKHSQHLIGRAADIKVRGVPPQIIYDYLDPFHVGGLGLYTTFVHVDSRGYRARWGLIRIADPPR